MTANYPRAYAYSALLHVLFAGMVAFTAYSLRNEIPETVQIFELVAGEGNNYAATEAPAEGSPAGVKFDVPAPKAPATVAPEPVPEPVAPPIPAPATPPPVEAVKAPKTPTPKAEPTPKNFAKQFEKNTNRAEKKIVDKRRREQEAIEKALAKAKALEEKRMTKADFDRENAKKLASAKTNSSGPVDFKRIDSKGIAGGVRGGTTDKPGAGGTALSREEQDLLGSYFALLKLRMREEHDKEKPSGLSDLLAAEVEFYVAANGAISQIRISDSSGNAEFDQSVISAIRKVGSIGARPDKRGDTRSVTFRMREED
jgi:colicin import membrane protein